MTEGMQPSARTSGLQPPTRKYNLLWAILPALLVGIADASLSILAIIRTGQWQWYVDAAGMLILATNAIIALVLNRRGQKTSAAWVMIFGIALIMVTKTIADTGVGILIGLAGIVFISIIGFLYLPTSQVNRALSLGYVMGAVTLLLEAYWPFERVASPLAASAIGNTVAIAAIAIGYPIFIFREFRYFNLYTKLIIAFNLAAVIPALIVGVINNTTSQARLTEVATLNLQNGAGQTAQAIDRVLIEKETAVAFHARIPMLADYLETFSQTGSTDPDAVLEATDYIDQIAESDVTYLQSVAILDNRGTVRYDSQADNIGASESEFAYYIYPLSDGFPYISPVFVGPDDRPTIIFSAPILSETGEIIGVLRERFLASILQTIVEQYNDYAGAGSYSLLIDENHIYLAHGLGPEFILRTARPLSESSLRLLQNQGRLPAGTSDELSMDQPELAIGLLQQGEGVFYITEQHEAVAGHPEGEHREAAATAPVTAQVSQQSWTVVYLQPEEIYLSPLNTQVQFTLASVAGVILFATLGSWALANLLSRPLLSLTKTAQQIEAGDLNAHAQVGTQDEVGDLASTLNGMTARLRDLVGSLEARVEERTRALERRAQQIQTAADVGSIASRLRNLDQLLKQVTQLISQRFGFYHVGIFLLDERSEYAVLRAANSEGGIRMLERNHKLKVGEVGIVGFVTQAGEPRIALDVGQDLNFTQNPDLPSTRSELCLPLLVGGKIIGALDVQSTQEAAFSEDDVTTLNVMAEQIAISIDNARLISESQVAIEAARRAYGEISQASWRVFLQQQIGNQGYLSIGEDDIVPVSGETTPEYNQAIRTGEPILANEGLTVYMPIKSRDLIIGAIRLDKPGNSGPWSSDDISAATTLADQLSTSIDSARLFRDINRQAIKERAISEISAKVSASINLESLFETAAREIGRTFPGTEVLVQLKED